MFCNISFEEIEWVVEESDWISMYPYTHIIKLWGIHWIRM